MLCPYSKYPGPLSVASKPSKSYLAMMLCSSSTGNTSKSYSAFLALSTYHAGGTTSKSWTLSIHPVNGIAPALLPSVRFVSPTPLPTSIQNSSAEENLPASSPMT